MSGKALKIDPVQKAGLKVLAQQARIDLQRIVDRTSPIPLTLAPDPRGMAIDKWSQGQAALLRPDQNARLRQIHLQALGAVALSDSTIQDELKLSDDRETPPRGDERGPGNGVL